MREIKFRFYPKNQITNFQGKTLQKMWEATSIDFEENEISNGGDIFSLNEVELMQYTGYKNKNGKEIYEGDIVEYLDASGFSQDDVGINRGIVELDLREGINFTNRDSVEMEDIDFDEEVEIIGNIYENPELLNN
ncbi:hypothetical protein BLM37_04405 [Candidatus Gracilibacteria bacterium GN02-873]|nr:hypothetical protein BLM37_04405 [Candidatus Gracilibacteria bacterium GN02-873]